MLGLHSARSQLNPSGVIVLRMADIPVDVSNS